MRSPEATDRSTSLTARNGSRITLAHGSGGRSMRRLIETAFAPLFASPDSEADHDGARLEIAEARLAFTTDSFVVDPIFFPGGDIGMLAVNGTINDLAMCGAKPLYLSVAMILEEGFPVESLERIARSMQAAADATGVRLVTGDTKVVERGRGHGIFITTAGIGQLRQREKIDPGAVRPGDAVIVNGDIGRHGIAVMSKREGLEFESELLSDCASLASPVLALIEAGVEIHCLRDLTRGGLATGLVEIAESSGQHIRLVERRIPVGDEVRGACEMLGFDPMYVANEGRFVTFVPASEAERTLSILGRAFPQANPVVIGEVTDQASGTVTMTSVLGVERIVDMLNGDQLPRIC